MKKSQEEKEKLKQEKKRLKDIFKKHMLCEDIEISKTKIPIVNSFLPKTTVDSIWNKQFESVYKREFGKLITKMKDSRLRIGTPAFRFQAEYLRDSKTELPTKLFNRKEVFSAMNEVLQMILI